MKQKIKKQIEQIHILLSPSRKETMIKLINSGILKKKEIKKVAETIDEIYKRERTLVKEHAKQKTSFIKSLEETVTSGYKKLLKKGRGILESITRSIELEKAETKINNL